MLRKSERYVSTRSSGAKQLPAHSTPQLNVIEASSDDDSSDGETLYTETESEESDRNYLFDIEELRYKSRYFPTPNVHVPAAAVTDAWYTVARARGG